MSEDTESQAAELVAPLFNAVANPHRIALLRGLHRDQSRTKLVQALPISESGVSNHLRVLEDAGLVYRTEDGWEVSPLGAHFAAYLDAHADLLAEAVTLIESAEAEARDELTETPVADQLTDQEFEAVVTRRKWEIVRGEMKDLVGQFDDSA